MRTTKWIVRSYSAPRANSSPGGRYVKPLTGVRKYVGEKILQLVDGYQQLLAKRFPRAFRIFQVFTVGTKDLYNDIVEYLRLSRDLTYGRTVRSFTYNELLTYMETPQAVKRMGPVLAVAALPFANYVVFPLAYIFPRYLLSPHFWSLEQKTGFQLKNHTRNLYSCRPVFRHLQTRLSVVPESLPDDETINYREKCEKVFQKIGSGVHATNQDILELKPLFVNKPFGLQYLGSGHLTGLCRMHGLSAFPVKRSRLWNYAGFLRELDLAISRDGGPQQLNLDQIRKACFMRGINPLGLSKEELLAYLRQWIEITGHLDRYSLSLVLHCPIFMAYNHPNNRKLVYNKIGS